MAWKPIKGKGWRYNPESEKPFRVSRSAIELFVQCPRCFYLDKVKGLKRPSMPGWTLNSATDELLKREFDSYREKQEPHPIMTENGIDAVPFSHPDIESWRNALRAGVKYHLPGTNIVFTGAPDDIWQAPDGTLYVIEYKSTSTRSEITLEDKWKQGYKRQLEVYQWLLRKNDFTVSDMTYFIYVNGLKEASAFNNELKFETHFLEYKADDSWVDGVVKQICDCLAGQENPAAGEECEFCLYRGAAIELTRQ